MAVLVRDCTFACIINVKIILIESQLKYFGGGGLFVWGGVLFICLGFFFPRVHGSDSAFYFVTESTDNCDLPERF